MNKTIFILFFSCGLLLAQEQVNYFPLAVGNKWVYIRPTVEITITKDTIMENGKQYYIFECRPYDIEYFFDPINPHIKIENFFIPRDPIRMGENGDIYAYNDSTQNEYLYLKFSDKQASGSYHFPEGAILPTDKVWCKFRLADSYIFLHQVGMITSFSEIADCWGTIWNPCPPYWNNLYHLVYAIIDGEKIYSVEETEEYLWYMRKYDVNPVPTNPQQIELHQNYPNPFNPETRIDFEIPKTEKVKLVIYNVLGKEIKTVLDDELHAGKYSTTWNGKDDQNNKVSSGTYFYRLTFGNNMQSITKKMIILK